MAEENETVTPPVKTVTPPVKVHAKRIEMPPYQIGAFPQREPGRVGPLASATATLDLFVRWTRYAAYLLLGISFAGEVIIILINIADRLFLNTSVEWIDEISGDFVSVIAFIGGAVAYAAGKQLAVTAVVDKFGRHGAQVADRFASWAVFAISAALLRVALQAYDAARGEHTLILNIPMQLTFYPCMIGAALLMLYSGVNALRGPWGYSLSGAAACAVLGGMAVYVVDQSAASSTSAVAIAYAMITVLLVALSVPIAFSLLALALIYAIMSGVGGAVPVVTMQGEFGSFVLVAIPCFVFSGLIMSYSGAVRPIAALFQRLFARLQGGPFYAVIAAMFVFSGISGSKLADVAAVGPAMREIAVGDPKSDGPGSNSSAEFAALLSASSVMGETIPPSVTMIVVGSLSTVSISALFIAGIIPAVVLGLCLMAVVFLRAHRMGAPRADAPFFRSANVLALGRDFIVAIPALFLPIILIGGIELGIATPTEVSAVAVLYGVLLTLAYRAKGRALLSAMLESIDLAGMVLFVIGAASAFSWGLAIEQVPQDLASVVTHIHSKPLFILASIVMLVVLGLFLEGLPAVIILTPIMLPLAADMNIDQLQYCIILIMALSLGAYLPPVGVGFASTCAVVKVRLESAVRPMLPYLGVLGLGILVVGYVPAVTLWLPHA